MTIAAQGNMIDQVTAALDAILRRRLDALLKRPKIFKKIGVPRLRANGAQVFNSGVAFLTGFIVLK